MNNIFKVLTRKKVLDPVAVTETRLARVLNTYDLTSLGVGSTLGVGVYVLAGHVARDTAGPSVVLSFLIAAIASVFAGLCYAEFGSRVPRAGSAYIYSYVTVGEFIAFVIGWNLILEYVIGSASVARGLSLYLDTLINNTLQDTFREIAPINVSFMSGYFDFFSCGLSILLAIALAFGIKESSFVNNIFTMLNIFVVLFVIIAGSFKANPKNWELPAPSNSTYGTGGFFPYGFSGMIKGAATCFYGFVGFDCIATTGEEVRNPQRAIPFSIIASLMIIFLAYFGTATVVTLMVPYYLQDVDAPIPHAFAEVGWEVAKWIVAIGGIFGLCASLFGAMFPLPRVIYAMASDGIIFKFLGNVHSRFRTPLVGTLLAGVLTGLMSALFELRQLVNMMSIGTLLAYTIVAACVLLLRYTDNEDRVYALIPTSESDDGYMENEIIPNPDNVDNADSSELIEPDDGNVTFVKLCKQTFNLQKLQNPTKLSQRLVSIATCIYALLCLALGLCVTYLKDDILHARVWAIVLVSIIGLFMILVIMSIATQPNSKKDIKFKVPLVPLIPALSILINIYLMLMLDVNTWIRFGVWMGVGLPMYFICVCKCTGTSLSNNTPKMHAIVNANISKTNGHINPSFTNGDLKQEEADQLKSPYTDDEFIDKSCLYNNGSNVINKKSKAPSPPAFAVNNGVYAYPDSVSVNGALAALDEVLSKEEVPFIPESPFARKLSIDTVSTASNAHLEESVVAVIHNEDVNPDPIPEELLENDTQSVHEQLENQVHIPPPPPFPPLVTESLVKTSAVPLPPPPPPIEGLKLFAPRVPSSRDDFHTILQPNLKPIIRSLSEPEVVYRHKNDNNVNDSVKSSKSPSPDYVSSRKDSVNEINDNITFGSKQHSKVMQKLNKLFERQSLGLPVINKLTKPETAREIEIASLPHPVAILPGIKQVLNRSTSESKDENDLELSDSEGVVVEEAVKPADIKSKLNEILRSDPRLTMRPLKSNIAVSSVIEQSEVNKDTGRVNNVNKNTETKAVNQVSDQLQHKDLMKNTLNSIKLRKIDSFKR